MLLAIDVGNSSTSLGVFEREALRCELRLSTRHRWTRDEVAIAVERALLLAGVRLENLDDAVLSCVVPSARAPVLQALSFYAGLDALVVEPGLATGLPVLCEPAHEVGADRIAAAVAAHDRYGARASDPGERGVVVVDFGTATAFDVVSPRPEYVGCVLAPGLVVGADALSAAVARLPRVEIDRPARVIGTNLAAAFQSGLIFGHVGLVEGVLRRIKSELPWPVRVVATGPIASDIARETSCIDLVDETLVLEGLRLIHARNRGI